MILARSRSNQEPNGTSRPPQSANRQLLGSPFLVNRLGSLGSVGASTADRQLFQGPAQRPGVFGSCRLAVGSEQRSSPQVLLRCAMEYLTFGSRRGRRERKGEGGRSRSRFLRSRRPLQCPKSWSVGGGWGKRLARGRDNDKCLIRSLLLMRCSQLGRCFSSGVAGAM